MIRFVHVSKFYQQKAVILDISLQIPKENIVVLVGLSGCGKTTTLKMINRLVEPSEGEIFIRDRNIKEWDPIKLRRRIGYVIQQTGLFPHITARQNIQMLLEIEKYDLAFIEERTRELMDLVGLDDEFLDRYPWQLSGGQQQRVGVARAFALNPDIVLMDEPFSALDPMTRADLQESLIDLQTMVKKTIVFVTHDMSEALKLGDYICIMDKGEIVQYGTPEDILKKPRNDFVSNFIGKNRIWSSPELIRVEDIMIKEPVICYPNIPLGKCMEKMRLHHVDSLMVVGEKRHVLLGVLYALDIQRMKDREQLAEMVMRKHPVTARPDDSILDVLQLIQDKRMVNIPVTTDNGQLVGLVTKSSLITTLSQQYFDLDSEA